MVPKDHWSLPEWIDEGRFMNSLEYLGAIGVGKGWMISYRHMCRWNSGFFYKHPRLKEFDWYWRVEPDVLTTTPELLSFCSIADFVAGPLLLRHRLRRVQIHARQQPQVWFQHEHSR